MLIAELPFARAGFGTLRLDVDVHAEQVVRVVRALDLNEPVVVGAVGEPCQRAVVLAEAGEVEVVAVTSSGACSM